MSMLLRYKKKGGFKQLLNLIETCGLQKQEKFLQMIELEDKNWADAIRAKMLTVKKIFSWEDGTVTEVIGRLNDLTIATAIFGLEEETGLRIYRFMANGRQKKIEDLMEGKSPNANEISAVYVTILTEVRQMIDNGFVYLDKIDGNLIVEPDIEERLNGASHDYDAIGSADQAAAELKMGASAAEVEQIRKKMKLLMAENNALKEKLLQAEHKLNQIRKKIA